MAIAASTVCTALVKGFEDDLLVLHDQDETEVAVTTCATLFRAEQDLYRPFEPHKYGGGPVLSTLAEHIVSIIPLLS